MRLALNLHPDSRCAAVTGVEIEAARPGPGTLVLRYVVTGMIADLRIPPVTTTARVDGLWRHTCFEAFVRASPGGAYYEVNLAPSSEWAAYRFEGYRSGMFPVSEMSVPGIETRSEADRYELRASLALDDLPDLPGDAPWQIGLSAVIEETGGGKSYWALAHPPGEPDFHHADCFALALPAA